MPKVKDKMTGEVVGEFAYNNEGIQAAENAADNNPNLEVDYETTNAANRSEITYLGGGSIPQYKEGGEVYAKNPKKKKKKKKK